MYRVSSQDVDERMIKVNYYYYCCEVRSFNLFNAELSVSGEVLVGTETPVEGTAPDASLSELKKRTPALRWAALWAILTFLLPWRNGHNQTAPKNRNF